MMRVSKLRRLGELYLVGIRYFMSQCRGKVTEHAFVRSFDERDAAEWCRNSGLVEGKACTKYTQYEAEGD